MVTEVKREWLTVREFVERHPNFSKNFLYELCSQKKILSLKAGGKVLIASDALELLAQGQNDAEAR